MSRSAPTRMENPELIYESGIIEIDNYELKEEEEGLSPAPQKKSSIPTNTEVPASVVSSSTSAELKEETSLQPQANLMAIAEEEEEVCLHYTYVILEPFCDIRCGMNL